MNHLYEHDNRDRLRQNFEDAIVSRNEYLLSDFVEHGEGYEGMANHVSSMTGLERMTFEDCQVSADNTTVMAPHLNLTPTPWYLRPRYIIAKTGCTYQEALDLLAAWEVIGNTQPLVMEYLRWIEKRDISSALKYFGRLAADLAQETEMAETEACPAPYEPQTAPNLFAYHKVGYDPDEPDFFETCPAWLQRSVREITQITDPSELAVYGKQQYKSFEILQIPPRLAGVFWTYYNRRKHQIEPRLTAKAEKIVAYTRTAKASILPKLGKRLYQLQEESQARGLTTLPPENWTIIWKTYQDRKASRGSTTRGSTTRGSTTRGSTTACN